ncbi:MAG: PQQ-like beta-propeller repeat protein [Planctomycetota bacterium]|nr:PQQ-like beta-propeller repeat protein [Planctomycetota bacterium]MDA1211380.1 PQQ-like beta-propeller repeat protein [Planctomycetota bacterium]
MKAFPKITGLVCLIVCVAMVGANEKLKMSGWPQWRGPARDGVSLETGLYPNWTEQTPELLWSINGLGKGYAGVSMADGRIYTTGNLDTAQTVSAYDQASGEMIWSVPVTDGPPKHGYDGSRCTPTVDDDRLYVVTSNGQILCMQAIDGEILWQKDFQQEWGGRMMSGWGFSESPLVDGDRVICTPGGANAMLVALDKNTGETIWESAVPRIGDQGGDGAGYASIIISEGAGVKQYVTLVGRGLVGVRADDGKYLWGYNAIANGTANISTPIAIGDYVFGSTGYRTGSGLVHLTPDGDGVKAEEVYFLDGNSLQNHHGGMVILGDYLYCGHGHKNGLPLCLEWKTGKINWGGDFRGVGNGSAAVIAADGKLIFRYESGEVALIDGNPAEYKLLGSFRPEVVNPPSWACPVVSEGNLYLRDQDTLTCYRIAP